MMARDLTRGSLMRGRAISGLARACLKVDAIGSTKRRWNSILRVVGCVLSQDGIVNDILKGLWKEVQRFGNGGCLCSLWIRFIYTTTQLFCCSPWRNSRPFDRKNSSFSSSAWSPSQTWKSFWAGVLRMSRSNGPNKWPAPSEISDYGLRSVLGGAWK